MRPSIRDDAARSDDRLKHTQERQGRGSAAGHGRDEEVGGGGGGNTPALHAIWLVLVLCRLNSFDPAGESLGQQEALTLS